MQLDTFQADNIGRAIRHTEGEMGRHSEEGGDVALLKGPCGEELSVVGVDADLTPGQATGQYSGRLCHSDALVLHLPRPLEFERLGLAEVAGVLEHATGVRTVGEECAAVLLGGAGQSPRPTHVLNWVEPDEAAGGGESGDVHDVFGRDQPAVDAVLTLTGLRVAASDNSVRVDELDDRRVAHVVTGCDDSEGVTPQQ